MSFQLQISPEKYLSAKQNVGVKRDFDYLSPKISDNLATYLVKCRIDLRYLFFGQGHCAKDIIYDSDG